MHLPLSRHRSTSLRAPASLTAPGRNIILLTLIVDGDAKASHIAYLWDAYYHLYVDDETAEVLLRQVQKLIPLLKYSAAWKEGPYGKLLKFCDEQTLHDVRAVCQSVLRAAQERNQASHRKAFAESLQETKDIQVMALGITGMNLSGMRSAAPLSPQATDGIRRASRQYLKEGTVTPRANGQDVPNPMFAGLVSDIEIIHYGTDPVLGFHLAAAFARLRDKSPLRPGNAVKGFEAAAAAKTQFGEWVSAIKQLFKRGLVLRFIVADVFAFCHTLQHVAASGKPTANWHRRQLDLKQLVLDADLYGTDREGPTAFDMIDTSNLSDHVGALNILIATAPLLKEKPWATVYTELMIKKHDSQKKTFDSLLCGHAPTAALLLGISPVQYWTNAKCESHVDEMYLGLMARSSQKGGDTQLHSRLAWKRDDQFSGQLHGRGRLHMDAATISRLLFQMYRCMFGGEDMSTLTDLTARKSPYVTFHRGSFAALLKVVKSRVATDWPQAFSSLLNSIAQDRTIGLSSNHMQELCVQMHLQGVNTESWLLNSIKTLPNLGPLRGWENAPLAVSVTLVVPREALTRLYQLSKETWMASPHLVASLRTSQWNNMYSDVHIAFGKVKSRPSHEDDPLIVEQDELGWRGSLPLIASFLLPTASLQVEPTNAMVGLSVMPSLQALKLYCPILGMSMSVFETNMDDSTRVFVSKQMPGQAAHRITCGGVRPLPDTTGEQSQDQNVKVTAEVAASESRISTVTGRVGICSKHGKALLQDKGVLIELRQQGPFVIDVVFGREKLICPLRFPVPITKEGSRTRIARMSGYVEVVAPVADPLESDLLADFILPSRLSRARIPVSLTAPHLNLDSLPILDASKKEAMTWLTALTSLQFSRRERALRETATKHNGMTRNTRVNFKESLFTMFMLTSGLQGAQTGMFAINHPERGGIHMLIVVSAMRLDGDAASVVLDAAVIPLTNMLVTSGEMHGFMTAMQLLQFSTINVDDAELVLWKKVLPSLVERCRTWNHGPGCEYKQAGATVPLSVEPAEQVLCSCGNGRLPQHFVSVPDWDSAAANAVRIAISPTYAVPFVEDVIDEAVFGQKPQAGQCHGCGKREGKDGGKMKKCARCLEAEYCSGACQKKDWKRHRTECREPNKAD